MPDIPVALGATTAAYLQLPGGWFLNNAGWIAGHDQTVLVDTCATEARTVRLLDALQHHTESRPLTAVITHAHGDHANGAGHVARAGGTILASSPAATEIATGPHTHPATFQYDAWGDIAPPAAIQPVVDRQRLDLGDQVIEVIPVGRTAHTAGDLVVWAPRDGVLFAGDLLFNEVTPLALSGSVTGWLATLDWLEQFEAQHLVPGHGPLLEPGVAIAAVRAYLQWLVEAADSSNEPDFDNLLGQARMRWPHWPDSERHAVNLRIAYAELHGTTCELSSALAAMVAAAGGVIVLDL